PLCVSLSLYQQEEELERLEREFAIQSQITEAARRLASDPHVSSKKLKKQRKTSYLNALKKLQEIENGINEHRVRSGKKPTQRASLIIEGETTHMLRESLIRTTSRNKEEANIGSEDSSLSDALVLDDGMSVCLSLSLSLSNSLSPTLSLSNSLSNSNL
uniref:Cytohesin Ubiquitin Protein Inducing domain-containing protein n=1 Tax=Hucho hucho TaxID=62062 RepID=A0A4W5M1Y2_9TELE